MLFVIKKGGDTMGEKTKIDWAESTWNPVTGCLHGCKYCYARRIAERFGGASETHNNECCYECQWETEGTGEIHDLNEPIYDYDRGRNAPYPFDFDPTFHRYRLDEPQKWKKPRNIFVCSMADLFGDWVPDEWIREVFQACEAAPQHRYLFLTKNPERLNRIAREGKLPQKHWYGYSASDESMLWQFHHAEECLIEHIFVSIEPILKPIQPCFSTHTPADWVIVGAETGNRKAKVTPERDWIMKIADECSYGGRPLFMKESLRELMGDDFRQEFPWE